MKTKEYINRIRLSLTVMVLALIVFPPMSEGVTPYKGSRIFWDMNTYKIVFPNGVYGRMMQLKDGRLFAINSAMQYAYSSDGGSSWDIRTLLPFPDHYQLGVPDMLQLSNGTIVVSINKVPLTWNSGYSSGIYVKRSTDYGATWGDTIQVYKGSNIEGRGCWEPTLLQLPSGELQCYFSNENDFPSTNYQNICLSRSYDNGLTWSTPEVISYRYGHRDGMPVPIFLKNQQQIVFSEEDNGWSGRDYFTATTIRTDITDNWASGTVNASSSKRNIAFAPTDYVSAAPYLRQLPNGETVLSYQGDQGRTTTRNDQYYDMNVVVGDSTASNFKGLSRPFALAQGYHSIVNSLAVVDSNVVAVGSIGASNTGSYNVYMIKGFPKRQANAQFGTVNIDGNLTSEDHWVNSDARQITMGQEIKKNSAFDFAYDKNAIYFTANVEDDDIVRNSSTDDGVYLMIDGLNKCSTTPQQGIYKFFFDTNGTCSMQMGDNGVWVDSIATDVNYALSIGTSSYRIEAAIPLRVVLGHKTPKGNLNTYRHAIDLKIQDVSSSGDVATETIADADENASWTWLTLNILKKGSVVGVPGVYAAPEVKTSISGGEIHVECAEAIKTIDLYSVDGRLVASSTNCGNSCNLPIVEHGAGIVCVQLNNGIKVNKKYIY
jgi:hypothetical protein